MTSSILGVIVALLLCSCSLAQSNATSCTVQPVPTSPPGLICGKRGTVSNPAYLAHNISLVSINDCQRLCSGFIGCKAFAYHPTQRCDLLSIRIRSQEFKKRQNESLPEFYNLKCFTSCPQDPGAPPVTEVPPIPSNIPNVTPSPIAYNVNATIANITAEASKDVVFGYVDNENNVLWTIMTFQTSLAQNAPLVNVESFIPFIETIDCQPSMITITFTSDDAYSEASQWPPVFNLITVSEQYCGSGDNRTFFNVTQPINYPNNNSIALPVSEIELSQVSTTFSINFGTDLASNGSDNAVDNPSNSQKTKTPRRLLLSKHKRRPDQDPRIPSIVEVIRRHFYNKLSKRDYGTPFLNLYITPQIMGYNSGSTNTYGIGQFNMECNPTPGNPPTFCGHYFNLELQGYAIAYDVWAPNQIGFGIVVAPQYINSRYTLTESEADYPQRIITNRLLNSSGLYTLTIPGTATFSFTNTLRQNTFFQSYGQISASPVGFDLHYTSRYLETSDYLGMSDYGYEAPFTTEITSNYQAGPVGPYEDPLISYNTGPSFHAFLNQSLATTIGMSLEVLATAPQAIPVANYNPDFSCILNAYACYPPPPLPRQRAPAYEAITFAEPSMLFEIFRLVNGTAFTQFGLGHCYSESSEYVPAVESFSYLDLTTIYSNTTGDTLSIPYTKPSQTQYQCVPNGFQLS